MVDHAYHGGACCGRRHIFGMNGATTGSILAEMRRQELLREEEGRGPNKITEIVLNASQNANENLRNAVLGAGFVLVAVWNNCSGSRCFMYLHGNDWEAYPNGAAVQLNVPVIPRPVREEPRVVSSTFHNVLVAGRSDAGWSSYARAREAAPRAGSVDRRDVYASGHVRWVVGIVE